VRKLVVEQSDRAAELIRGPYGAHGIVLVHDGNTEDGHHGVPDELLDGPAVTLDHATRLVEVAGHHAPEALGVESFSQRGRSGDVAEDDRDRLALLLRIDRRGLRRTAAVTEARTLPDLGTAGRARVHA
jgi:hypothetical protein